MNALSAFAGLEVWHIAGWTMLHYLWLGTLIGAMAIVLRLLLRRAAANVRYAVALGCLILLAASPIGIATWLMSDPPPLTWLMSDSPPLKGGARGGISKPGATVELNSPAALVSPAVIELHNQQEPLVAEDVEAGGGAVPASAPQSEPSPGPARPGSPQASLKGRGISLATLETCVPYLPWLWIVGTPITFALLAAGIVGTKRLRRTSLTINDGPIIERLARLASSLHIARRVSVAVCERVASPVLVGILRPMILLPPAAITGWSPDEIEMVLLHELAHVRRWDNLVNLIQRLIESLLFFHPAVWVVSTWIRRERETCCDAFVVGRTERPHAYAELLVALAAQMPRSVLFHPAASSAMSAGPLQSRIRRILQLEKDPMLISGKSLTLMLASLFVAATFALLYLPTLGQAEESTTEVTEDTEPIEVPGGDAVERSEPKAYKNLNTSGPAATAIPIEATALIPIETELLLREIAGLQKRRAELEGRLYELQTEFTVLKGRLSESEPNLELQQLTKEFQIGSGALRTQLAEVTKSLGEKIKTLLKETERSVELESRDVELKLLQEKVDVQRHVQAVANQIELKDGQLLVQGIKKLQIQSGPPAARERARVDDWPVGVAFPSPKEGEISKRAWHALGIKIVPATQAEQREIGGRMLIVVGGVPLPEGTQGKMFLQSVGEFETETFDELVTALDKVKSEDFVILTCTVATDRGPLSLQVLAARPAATLQTVAPAKRAVESRASKFPSLEVQKLADVAWKRLGLELEPIGNVDLKRVQALGYDGGLKVSAGVAGLAHSGVGRGENIQTGDILVGLHVWPTINMKDLAAILNRDDLRELNPLKFYVVRQVGDPALANPLGEKPSPADLDNVVTGRVYVQLGGESPDPRQQPSYGPQESRASVPAAATAAVSDSEAPSYVLPPAEAEAAAPPKSRKRPTRPSVPSMLPLAGGGTPLPVAPDSKSALRYDGKSFDEWRNEWQTELSTKKRLEAVNALAAFGRAGHGKEAADAILDVAGEYDFSTIDNTGEDQIKNAVLGHLAPYGHAQSTAMHWVPSLVARLAEEPRKWQSLAIGLLRRLRTEEKDTIAILRSLAEDGPQGVRSAALGALVRSNRLQSGGPRIDDTTQALLTAALKSKDPAVIREALDSLYYQPMPGGIPGTPETVFQAELIPLVFHSDKTIQQHVRYRLRDIQDDDAPQAVESLLAVLKDDSRKHDRLAAIRALGTIGPKATAAQPQLETIFADESQDMPLRVATAFAVDRIEGGVRLRNELNHEMNNLPDEKAQTKLNQLFNAEQQIANE